MHKTNAEDFKKRRVGENRKYACILKEEISTGVHEKDFFLSKCFRRENINKI
jgi:hypothetical protein